MTGVKGITIQGGTHAGQPRNALKETSEAERLEGSGADKGEDNQKNDDPNYPKHVSGSSNGFIHACLAAFDEGRHLYLRPHDVWFAILSQLSFHVNADAKGLGHLFAKNKDRDEKGGIAVKKCRVQRLPYKRSEWHARRHLAEELIEKVRDTIGSRQEESDWIEPEFSTTGDDERIAASVIWLGAPPESFSFRCRTKSGIPSVTLLENRSDWVDILGRVHEYLRKCGRKSEVFVNYLMPVLEFFLKSFDEPDSPDVQSFWSKMIRYEEFGSGKALLSGWITAFCFWDAEGNLLRERFEMPGDVCALDGHWYHRVNMDEIPGGYASLPVTMKEGDERVHAKIMAGSMGITASRQYDRDFLPCPTDENCVQPQSGWRLFKDEGDKEWNIKEEKSDWNGLGLSNFRVCRSEVEVVP